MRNAVLVRRRRWIARAFGRNPLLRWTDRVEACVVLAAIALALAVCPVCVGVGVEVYRSHAQHYAQEFRTRHIVTASVAAKGKSPPQPHTTSSDVLAVWSELAHGARGGELRVGHAEWVTVDHAIGAGDQIHLWVDDAGTQVDPPTPPTQAGFDAIAVVGGIWGATILGLMAAVGMLRSSLNRIRQVRLDREIERFASGGTTKRPH